MEWYVKVLKQYADFSGRARRKEYWMFVLFNILIAVGIAIVEAVLLGLTMGVLSMIYALAVLLPGLAVTVRRLHDTGRSGWWVLISLIPFIGVIVLLVFMATDGEQGTNQWGPNPKAMSSAAAPAAA